MSDFLGFKKAVRNQLKSMEKTGLYVTGIDKDLLWKTYLDSFPEGSNPLYKERTEHDCQCCNQFIRAGGDVVTIVNNKIVSIWDVSIGGDYQVVADALSELIKTRFISNAFFHVKAHLGTDFNHQQLKDSIKIRDHFYSPLSAQFVKRDAGTMLSEIRSNKEVLKRSLEELTSESAEIIMEMIVENTLARGEEHKRTVALFLKLKKAFDKLGESEKDNYCWIQSAKLGMASKIRNSVIGTLLDDISTGVELDEAVNKFEYKVEPQNFKRTTGRATKGMITSAERTVKRLGFENSLQRRFAIEDDITINNVLYADRSVKENKNIFEEMAEEVPVKVKNSKKITEVSAATFIDDILPEAKKIELLLENKHTNNLMSLISPVDTKAKGMFKWNNNFSWSYKGEVTDSIKERVKRAGGNVTGVLRCSLSWFNLDDLDIHIKEPNGNHIYYSNARTKHPSSGILDIDMNAGSETSRNAVENIAWTNKAKMQTGVYKLYINQYQQRENIDVGFDVEIEFGGVIHSFRYDKLVKNNVNVAEFRYSPEKGIEFISSLPSVPASKEIWNVSTEKYHKVSMIMKSPNHWDGQSKGNKHMFFILDGCKNDQKARGFYNEFLVDSLILHRKVFEVLSSKMKTDESDNQLSGLGFSSTQKNSVLCKVTGSFNRTIKINF